MAESIAVLVTKPPYGVEDAFAGMRLSLAMLASGLINRSTVILVGEGTLNAMADQRSEAIGMPSNAEAVTDLTDFEAEVYCVEEDLRALVGEVETLAGVQMVTWERARAILDEHELVTTF